MVVQIQLSAYTTTIRLQKSKKHQNTRFPKTNIPKIRPWKVPEAFVFLRQILYSSHNTSSNLQIQLTTHKEFINNSFRIIPQKSAPPFPYPFLVLPLFLSSSFPALPPSFLPFHRPSPVLPCPSLPRPSSPSIVLPFPSHVLPSLFSPHHPPATRVFLCYNSSINAIPKHRRFTSINYQAYSTYCLILRAGPHDESKQQNTKQC